ncbi:acyl-CoA reductase [Cytobacillus gottheilii]|uniref:acyl-CoA reductase n=1 Tax=Cytobacillus gottheilii TaxID=859144 RepID=UPI002495990F|nr:acyl-CoA reductase [Cytobacillus gottheilii]
MEITAGYLPEMNNETIEYREIIYSYNGLTAKVKVPQLSPQQLSKIMSIVKANAHILKSFSVSELVAIIDQAIHILLDRQSKQRRLAETWLPIITGYDQEIIRTGLTTFLQRFRKHELQRFLVEDFGNPQLLDDFQPLVKGGYSKAVGADVTGHFWAGNVPGLPLWSFISALLVKSGSVGKTASEEPLFAGLFADILAEVEPKIKNCFAIVTWKGGDEEREALFFEGCETIIAYGSDQSLASIKQRVPVTSKLISHGHKISFSIIGKESLHMQKAVETSHLAALDLIRYDQQGCYSPQAIFVQKGGLITPGEFAKYLAHELSALEIRFPRRELSIEESASFIRNQQREEMSLFAEENKEIISDENGRWIVIYKDHSSEFLPSVLNRSIQVFAFDEIDEVLEKIKHYKKWLQTAGMSTSPENVFLWSQKLSLHGITRMTGIGRMTSPEAGWHQDGGFSLADLVKMTDIEASTLELAEPLSAYSN